MEKIRPNLHILDFPPEVLENILIKVANFSYREIFKCKSVCVAMRDACQRDTFYRSVDLFIMQKDWYYSAGVHFNRLCLHHENPSTIFNIGAREFFRTEDMEGRGLSNIRLAAEKGYDLALYTYNHLNRIMSPNVVFDGDLVNISKEFSRSAKRKIQASTALAWSKRLPPFILQRVTHIQNVYCRDINSCPCQVINRWRHPWDELYKPEPLCDACFWKMETLAFIRELPSKIVDMRLQ